MTLQELEMLNQLSQQPLAPKKLTLEMLGLPKDFTGTIAFGYNCDRDTMHLYAEDGVMTAIWYDKPKGKIINCVSGDDLTIDSALANKRLYSERTLFEYAQYLLVNDIHPRSLTSFDKTRAMEKGEFGFNTKRLCDFQ